MLSNLEIISSALVSVDCTSLSPRTFRLSIFQPWTAHFNHIDSLAGLVNDRVASILLAFT